MIDPLIDEDIQRVAQELAKLDEPVALLEALFAHAPFAMQLYDASGRSVLINRAFRQTYLSEPPPDYNVFRDEVARSRGLTDLIQRAFAGETIVTPRHWYDPRELRHVQVTEARRVGQVVTMVPLRTRRGNVGHVAVFGKDVTEEMLAQERSEADRVRLTVLADVSAAVGSMSDGASTAHRLVEILVPRLCDACTLMLMREDGALSRVAMAGSDERLDRTVRALDAEARDGFVPPEFSAVAASGETVLIEDFVARVQAIRPEGDGYRSQVEALQPTSVICAPLRAPDRITGVIVLGMTAGRGRAFAETDVKLAAQIGERIGLALDNTRLYEALKQSEARAQAADRRKDEFLAILGHELRNPLAPIVTALELMKRREGTTPSVGGAVADPQALRQVREVIERQVKHMSRLVDDLLDLSRITRGKIELERKRIELGDVVAQGVELASPLLEKSRHVMDVDVPAGLQVWGDSARLTQIVSNLINNAAKFTPAQGRIRVHGRANGETVELEVSDNGQGFDPQRAEELFGLFVQGQGEAGAERRGGGLGVGLALVRSLAMLHGGTVTAESAGIGQGSRFVVCLPALPHAAAEATRPSNKDRAVADAPRVRRVLIVDDNTDAAAMLAAALEQEGHQVFVAPDALAAMEIAARAGPHIGILDIGLPVMDGYELAGRLRQSPTLKDMQLIALTGYGQVEDRARAIESGFDQHFVKPVDVETLLAALR